MEKYARQALSEGIKNPDDLRIALDSELYRVLNLHYTSDVGLQPGITGADEIYSNCSRKAWDLKYSGT